MDIGTGTSTYKFSLRQNLRLDFLYPVMPKARQLPEANESSVYSRANKEFMFPGTGIHTAFVIVKECFVSGFVPGFSFLYQDESCIDLDGMKVVIR